MDVDVVLAGEEEALAYGEVGEAFALFIGEFEDVGENVYGGSGLFEEELHGGVGDDGAADFTGHEIFYVLGDGGETEIVFTGTFGEGEEEVGGIVVLDKLPGFIYDEHATFLLGADYVPDVGEDDIHGDGAKFVF